MLRTVLVVFLKEFVDNLRDRRTLLSALLFGPLFGPVLFGVMVTHMLNEGIAEPDEALRIVLSGHERAPGLEDFLTSRGVSARLESWSADEAGTQVRAGAAAVVIVVPAEYARLFAAGLPSPVLLVADSADSGARKHAARARALLGAYAAQIAQLRLQVRGVSPLLSVPLAVEEIDVATPAGRAVMVLGFMTYFVLFAVLMGGLYLAIDSTAGERERGSLEALLALPVGRAALLGGKLLATCAYMCLSLAISLSAFVIVFRFVPLERLGMSANLGWSTGAAFFAICLPFVPLGAALMTLVASFTRSYREAQTYLASVLLVPTLPIAFASVYSLRTSSRLMFVPSLSQHLLMTSILKDQPVAALDVLVSGGASLSLALLLVCLTAYFWRRETMLG